MKKMTWTSAVLVSRYPFSAKSFNFCCVPSEHQQSALRPTGEGQRKLVLATNIAETSLTIPGIRHIRRQQSLIFMRGGGCYKEMSSILADK
jgi:hypothetical protein